MPDGDGLSVAGVLSGFDVPPTVIFVTAHSDRALAALEAGAVAYLVKPVLADRLQGALARARRPTRALVEVLEMGSRGRGSGRTHIGARVGRELRRIPVSEVRYFRAADKVTVAVYTEGEMIVEESLDTLETEFAPDFTRVRRNLLIARAAIRGLKSTGGGYRVILDSGESLPVARRQVAALRDILQEEY